MIKLGTDNKVYAPAWAANTVPLSLNNAASTSVAVTFPAGRFTAAPVVVTVTETTTTISAVSARTPTGFTAWLATANAAKVTLSTTVDWIARVAA
jgi:hypothetical protein